MRFKCICENCQHFRQHYVVENGCAKKLFTGHCTAGIKKKIPTARLTQCDKFEPLPINCEENQKMNHIKSTLNQIDNLVTNLQDYIQKDAKS